MSDVMIPATILLVCLIVFVTYITIKRERDKVRAAILEKNRRIVLGCESFILNPDFQNLSDSIKKLLYKRLLAAHEEISQISSEVEHQVKIRQVKNTLEGFRFNVENETSFEEVVVPKEQLFVIAKVKYIKRVRRFIFGEKARGRMVISEHTKEDLALSLAQLKLIFETYYNAAIAAKIKNQTGTARNYFEKCLKVLDKSKINNEYTENKYLSIKSELEDIKNKLKAKQDEHLKRIKEQENPDYEQLFAPKRKWY